MKRDIMQIPDGDVFGMMDSVTKTVKVFYKLCNHNEQAFYNNPTGERISAPPEVEVISLDQVPEDWKKKVALQMNAPIEEDKMTGVLPKDTDEYEHCRGIMNQLPFTAYEHWVNDSAPENAAMALIEAWDILLSHGKIQIAELP